MDKIYITLAFVAIASIPIGHCGPLQGFGDTIEQPFQHAINKLELYALGLRSKSLLTMDLLLEAYEDFSSWEPNERNFLLNKMPLARLFVNFALIPLENWHLQKHTKVSAANDLFIQRLEGTYKLFRPAYLGRFVGNHQYRKSPKLNALVDAMLELDGAKPITPKLIRDAEKEYSAVIDRLHEIETDDDIYGCKDEYETLINLFNRDEVRVMIKDIFPLADEAATQQGIEKLQQTFLVAMREKATPQNRYKL